MERKVHNIIHNIINKSNLMMFNRWVGICNLLEGLTIHNSLIKTPLHKYFASISIC